jgi:hypothetical protein
MRVLFDVTVDFLGQAEARARQVIAEKWPDDGDAYRINSMRTEARAVYAIGDDNDRMNAVHLRGYSEGEVLCWFVEVDADVVRVGEVAHG